MRADFGAPELRVFGLQQEYELVRFYSSGLSVGVPVSVTTHFNLAHLNIASCAETRHPRLSLLTGPMEKGPVTSVVSLNTGHGAATVRESGRLIIYLFHDWLLRVLAEPQEGY